MKRALIDSILDYKAFDNEEEKMKQMVLDYLEGTDDYLGKVNPEGHITGSCWIVNSTKDKVLLTHHLKLNIWVQLGGHTELDETVLESAYREGIEESGFENLKTISNDIYDIDVHLIPERKGTKAHYHYDIRYVFEADDSIPFVVSDESHDLKWVAIKDIEMYSNERSILRMVEKMEKLWA